MNNWAGFSSGVGTVLGVSVALQGVQAFIAGLQKIHAAFQALPTVIGRANLALMGMSLVSLGFIAISMKMGAEQQKQRMLLETWSGSVEKARYQMEAVERISSRGIFNENEILQAINVL